MMGTSTIEQMKSRGETELFTVMRGQRGQQAYLLTLGVVMTAASLIVIVVARRDLSGLVIGWIGLILFGSGTLVFVNQLLYPPTLCLDAAGFIVRGATFRRRRAWVDVSEFVVAKGPHSRSRVLARDTVYYDLVKPAQGRWANRWRSLNRALVGHDEMLPDNYGLSADELAKELNRRRAQVVGRS